MLKITASNGRIQITQAAACREDTQIVSFPANEAAHVIAQLLTAAVAAGVGVDYPPVPVSMN